MKRLILLIALAAALPSPAAAAIVTRQDTAGRTMVFDLPAGTNVSPYASVLRGTLHSDEIESVTIRVVSRRTLARACGSRSSGCYLSGWRGGAAIFLSGDRRDLAAVLMHEYAHHLDATYGLTSSRRSEPAARRWWAARRIAQRIQTGQMSLDYDRGWQRAIAEIFAEDYVQLGATGRYGIGWLAPPSNGVRSALRTDLLGAFAHI
jgi:hypothetical protein